MRDRLLYLAMGVLVGAAVATILTPEPAVSQSSPQPISISYDYQGYPRVFVLYDNATVWSIDITDNINPGDVSYPGGSTIQPMSWGRIKAEYRDE